MSNNSSKFTNYMEQVDSELKESNYSSDDIASLINCREIIDGHLEYLRNLSVNYYEASKIEEAKYKEARAKIVLDAKNPTVGLRESEAKEYEIKGTFIAIESKYKRMRSFVESLEGKSDTLKQKIGYLRQEEQLTKFIK